MGRGIDGQEDGGEEEGELEELAHRSLREGWGALGEKPSERGGHHAGNQANWMPNFRLVRLVAGNAGEHRKLL